MRGSRCIKAFKRRAAWAIDKRLQVISNKILFKTVTPLKTKELSHFNFKSILYALLRGPWLCILINAYEDMCPVFKQEAAKKAGQL